MRKCITAAVMAATMAGPALADPVLGLWKTQPDDGAYAYVRMESCGAKICGVIDQAFGANGQAVKSDRIGAKIVWDMTPAGGGKYTGGKIFRPSNGKTYKSKMALSGDQLKVSGCIGPICQGQDWTRVK